MVGWMGAGRRRWTKIHETERLLQLLYDVKSMAGRYITLCLEAAEQQPAVRQEWEAAAERAQAAQDDILQHINVLLKRVGGDADGG